MQPKPRHSLKATRAFLLACVCAAISSVASAAPVTLQGTSVSFEFDTATWTAFQVPAFSHVSPNVVGNTLQVDFGPNWGEASSTANCSTSGCTMAQIGWFQLPMQYTAAPGRKIDGYQLTIGGTWSTLRDPSAGTTGNQTTVSAGLRTDGQLIGEPTTAWWDNGSTGRYAAGSYAGSFSKAAFVDGSSALSLSGEILAASVAGACAYAYDNPRCSPPLGQATAYLQTLSVEVLTSPVPEASAFALFVAGLGVLTLAARRRAAR